MDYALRGFGVSITVFVTPENIITELIKVNSTLNELDPKYSGIFGIKTNPKNRKVSLPSEYRIQKGDEEHEPRLVFLIIYTKPLSSVYKLAGDGSGPLCPLSGWAAWLAGGRF